MSKHNLLELLNNLLKEYSYNDIANKLNISSGTIKRWIELQNIPNLYCFDLMKIANLEIDYTNFTAKEKDQFYTPPETAKYCYLKSLDIIKQYGDNIDEYHFIEPSAGNGSFLELMPKNRRIGFDIEPKKEEIIKQDYLEWKPILQNNKYIVIGNPPFGLRGQLALKFINHSSHFSDYVCFILPQLFESDGKGVPRKRVTNLNLIYSEKLKTDFIDPTNKKIKVECIFQIWSKTKNNFNYEIKKYNNNILKIYSLSDGGTPSTTRNKKMFNECDIYLPSTCFGKENMKYYLHFEDLPNRKGYGIVFNIDKEENIKKFKKVEWSDIAFLSTNSAYNIRTSQIKSLFIE